MGWRTLYRYEMCGCLRPSVKVFTFGCSVCSFGSGADKRKLESVMIWLKEGLTT